MNSPRFLATRIAGAAALLLSAWPASAITDTWDGGAPFDDLLSTGTNWADNSAPVSDLANTDLIFAGVLRTTPDVGVIFSTRSVTFNNTANPFTISGQRLNIGTGGIVNSDTQTMTFTNVVNFSGVAASTINASAGRLTFNGLVTLPTGTLTVTGSSPTTFDIITGAGAINKTGAGVMTWSPDAASGFDITVGAGTLTLDADGSTDVFNSTSSLAVNGSSTLNLNEGLTLDGAQLTRAGGASLNLAAGKTLTVQNGGDAVISGGFANSTASTITVTGAGSTFSNSTTLSLTGGSTHGVSTGGTILSGTGLTTVGTGSKIAITGGTFRSRGNLTLDGGLLTRDAAGVLDFDAGTALTVQAGGDAKITGAHTHSTAATLLVTGAASSFSTSSNLSIQGGSTLNVAAGGSVSSGTISLEIGGSGNGTVTVDGAGSSLSGTLLRMASDGSGLTFTNSSTGTFSGIVVAPAAGAGSIATLNILSGATVSGTALSIAEAPGAGSGTVTIADGTLSLTGGAASTIGASDTSTGALNIQPDATFISTTGLMTVNATGTVAITTGSYESKGDFTLNGGQLTCDFQGDFLLNPGKTLTVQAGGSAVFTGTYQTGNLVEAGSFVSVSGAGSTLTAATFIVGGGGTANVTAGGNLHGGSINIGTFFGDGTATVDGTGSVMGEGEILNIGASGKTGSLTFTNGSTGSFARVQLGFTGIRDSRGTLNIMSGSTVSAVNLSAGVFLTGTFPDFDGSVLVSGPGSALTLTDGDGTEIGGFSPSPSGLVTGTVTVENGGLLTSGPGILVNTTGRININAGGTFTTTGTGSMTLTDPGRFDVNAGGTLTGTGDFSGPGLVNIAGTFLPGTASGAEQTTIVTFAQNMTFQPTTGITLELGGLAPGTQHDQLVFNGLGATHVSWNGTLNLVLINGFTPQAGQTFNLFDFDAARDAGTFTTINLPTLTAGLLWSQANLYTIGGIEIALDPVFISRTWDGGGANNNWITDNNWTLDVQPLNNATADLIFTGNVRLTPSVDTPWNVRSIVFNNTAGAFTLTGPEGIILGSDGVTNNDTQTQTIDAAITLSADQSFTAGAGDLDIDSIALAGRTLALAGGNDIVLAITSGTGTIDKNNTGRLDVTGALGTGGVKLNANEGTTNIGADQTLAALNIADGAIVVLGAIAPAAPFAPVPEPGSFAMVVLGMIGLVGRRRRIA